MNTAANTAAPALDELVGRRPLERRYGRCGRTIARWLEDPRVAFPKPAMLINGRRYWSLKAIEAWEREQAAKVSEVA
ncbi:hypothetical protein PX554_11865 [Sphingomonas sp. H39-1-10]|uniref:hypothetical protein n=1 Tax=Sphingomonas pollutisoli TaxID=3030829 RepID=UPI0023B91DD4|nr:hypothetical protein [Sphingomonas pollutisoli]MDF0488828.1 hypothetical protein [Sphingomonas pollutisoli]